MSWLNWWTYVVDVIGWFFLGETPPWWKVYRTRKKLSGRGWFELPETSPQVVLSSRRKSVPTSGAPAGAAGKSSGLSVQDMHGAFDSPPPVSAQRWIGAVEQAELAVRYDTPTITMKVIGGGVDHPCVVCGEESTSALLDRCDRHEGKIATTVIRQRVSEPLGRVAGWDTGEYEALLESELARLKSSDW